MIKKYNYIYLTTNRITGKKYVGEHSTNNLDDGYIGSGTYLKNSIVKHGKKNFVKKILEFCNTKEEAFLKEPYWIKEYNTLKPNGYNQNLLGGYTCINMSEKTKEKISISTKKGLKKRAYIFTEEHKRKLSEAAKGRKQSPEHKEKSRKARIGKKHSEQTKKLMSQQRKGIFKSENHKAKIGLAQIGEKNHMYGKIPWNKGKSNNLSEEGRKKIIEIHRGNKYRLVISHTIETKEKISRAGKGKKTWAGKKHTIESRKKMSESHMGNIPGNKGKKHTEEARKKMSEAKKGIILF